MASRRNQLSAFEVVAYLTPPAFLLYLVPELVPFAVGAAVFVLLAALPRGRRRGAAPRPQPRRAVAPAAPVVRGGLGVARPTRIGIDAHPGGFRRPTL